MKQSLLGIFLLLATTMAAQPQPLLAPAWSDSCEMVQQVLELPNYYCRCKEGARTFAFPVEMMVKDTMWYTATMDDVLQGISAYWFSKSSVMMDVFAFCYSKAPTFSLSVGPNQMRDMDADVINAKLAALDEQAKLMAKELTPHIRVYPQRGDSGKVYCYPYDQGPESKCDDPLPLRIGMTYVCDKEKNVYRMEWSSIAASGKSFIRWKQKQNKSCEIWLTLDSCTGEEIGRATLSDSLHVYQPDSAQLVDARKAKRSLWLHVKHAAGYTGRVFCYNNPKYAEEALDPVTKKTCYGKTLSQDFRTYTRDTSFIDTLWVNKDTLTTRQVTFTFTQPTIEYDTVYVTQTELASGYIYNTSIFTAYGDYMVEIRKTGACTRYVQVTIAPEPTQGIDYVGHSDKRSCKYLRNGQLFILIDDRKYNVLGQEQK